MNLQPIATKLIASLANELINQGHRGTGKLIASLKSEVDNINLKVVIKSKFYAIFVNNGVLPSQIKSPFAPKRIQALRNWVMRVLKKSDKEAQGLAYAIAKTHKEQGMPSFNSYRHSKNGRRRNFVQFAIASEKKFIKEELKKEFTKDFQVRINNIIAKTK